MSSLSTTRRRLFISTALLASSTLLRWNCVTATEPELFQAPFRAGIITRHFVDPDQIESDEIGSASRHEQR
jgi:hypothetical protein